MKTPIAIKNLWHQGAKTIVSIGGVAFALLLVFMQLGFMGAVQYTARNVLEKLDFDILIRASDYLHLYEASNFDREWLVVAENTDGVKNVAPLWIMIHNWRQLPTQEELLHDEGDSQGIAFESFETQYLPIAITAFETHQPLFMEGEVPELTRQLQDLQRSDAILLDDATKQDYGPWNGTHFTSQDVELSMDSGHPERRPEIGGAEYRIAGLFKLGTGLAANAAAFMGREAFERIYPWDVRTTTTLGLIQLHDRSPEQLERVLRSLRERMHVGSPPEGLDGSGAPSQGSREVHQPDLAVTVLSKQEAIQAENDRWLKEMPIGLIFQMGVFISLLVGAAIVYMVLSTDVTNRLPEYATLLAMGYSRKYLASIVMTQAIVLCALGFLSALVFGELLYRLTSSLSGIPLRMTLVNIVMVGCLGLVMCVVSGLLALRKLWKAEPATLF